MVFSFYKIIIFWRRCSVVNQFTSVCVCVCLAKVVAQIFFYCSVTGFIHTYFIFLSQVPSVGATAEVFGWTRFLALSLLFSAVCVCSVILALVN